jgi:PDZ domain-containing protein
VTPQIRYDGRPRYDPTGALEMTTVSYHQVSPLQALAVWLEPDWALVPQADLYPTGNVALENQRSISQMDQSKIDATGVVLRRLANYPKDHGAGALVESTVPDCSADGRLFPGDIIEAIDGKPVGDTADVRRILHHAKEGQALSFRLDVDGKVERATFVRKPCGPDEELLVGVPLHRRVPVPGLDRQRRRRRSVRRPDVGPRALRADDAGRSDRGTHDRGYRDDRPSGQGRGPIGGIRDKVVAAQRAGASIFLAPADDMGRSRRGWTRERCGSSRSRPSRRASKALRSGGTTT